ncbi:hypothetical protein Mal52_05650 [Symmachiella dynata]|uniref:Uncharacterized protein n=1 Tax=Symmachiella dynata TaxID=2527995 RepID=A0A517ZI02_9PLAN|nr:hypothetical protein [Symmachiella dynata]QDU42110.1 hypothetical protein Mal52_05650 [Symmachiella dynata]
MSLTVEEFWGFCRDLTGDPSDDDALHYLLYDIALSPVTKESRDGYHFYWCCPLNAIPFANTSMDGAHFSLLDTETDVQPVILVAPDAFENPYVVVGESFYEFLCLGCVHGFACVAAMAHRPSEMVKYLEGDPDRDSANETARERVKQAQWLLEKLRERFQLHPWQNVGQRLFELQEEFLDAIEIPPEDEDQDEEL